MVPGDPWNCYVMSDQLTPDSESVALELMLSFDSDTTLSTPTPKPTSPPLLMQISPTVQTTTQAPGTGAPDDGGDIVNRQRSQPTLISKPLPSKDWPFVPTGAYKKTECGNLARITSDEMMATAIEDGFAPGTKAGQFTLPMSHKTKLENIRRDEIKALQWRQENKPATATLSNKGLLPDNNGNHGQNTARRSMSYSVSVGSTSNDDVDSPAIRSKSNDKAGANSGRRCPDIPYSDEDMLCVEKAKPQCRLPGDVDDLGGPDSFGDVLDGGEASSLATAAQAVRGDSRCRQVTPFPHLINKDECSMRAFERIIKSSNNVVEQMKTKQELEEKKYSHVRTAQERLMARRKIIKEKRLDKCAVAKCVRDPKEHKQPKPQLSTPKKFKGEPQAGGMDTVTMDTS